MKQRWTRFGVALFCLMLLTGLMGVPMEAGAEENADFETDFFGRAIFTSFEELKELASRTDGKYTSAIYQGTEALVIEEDLTMPDGFQLYTNVSFFGSEDCKIIVPEGVTLNVDLVSSENLILDGTLVCYKAILYCDTFQVFGKLYLDEDGAGYIPGYGTFSGVEMMLAGSKVVGIENIDFGNEQNKIVVHFSTKLPLTYILEAVQKTIHQRVIHTMNCYGEEITIDTDVTFPESLCLEDCGGITVNDSLTLATNSYSNVYGPIIVNGTLNNQGKLDIWCDDGGSLTISETGSYTGMGEIFLNKRTLDNIESVVFGLDLSQFEISEHTDFSKYWKLAPASEPEASEPSRVAGANRFDTALVVADQMKANLGIEKFNAAIIASGTNFSDALSGSYLASVKNAPILLSFNETYNNLAKDYIRENVKPGGTVYILGGDKAVPLSMETGLDEFTVKRLAGMNRFETNLMILEEAGVGDKPILVCTGTTFADSLSASATELPILLVWNKLFDSQKRLLEGLGTNQFYIIGGESAVPWEIAQQVGEYGKVERVMGSNRFDTSLAIANRFFEEADSVVLAYAWNFPDGLCGGPLAATMDAPLILTMDKYEATAAAYIQGKDIKNGIILGSESLISQETVNNIFN